MKNRSWKTIKTEVFKKTPWSTFQQNEFEMPNGKKGVYYFMKSNGSCFIVPVLGMKIVLTRQYRYLIDEESLEFPGGGIKEGQTAEEAAQTELKEETGYSSDVLEFAGEFCPWNGATDGKCKVFIARNLVKGEKELEETEEGMENILVGFDEMDEMIKNNTIKDGQTLASWAMVRCRLK